MDPRNHPLVSGFCVPENEIIADSHYNTRKSNRFVPYRVGKHGYHHTYGDVGEFLINGEWTECVFGGAAWNAEANRIGNAQVKGGHVTKELGVGIHGIDKVNSQRWECTVTGFVSTPGSLTRYQQAKNIDTSNRIRIM